MFGFRAGLAQRGGRGFEVARDGLLEAAADLPHLAVDAGFAAQVLQGAAGALELHGELGGHLGQLAAEDEQGHDSDGHDLAQAQVEQQREHGTLILAILLGVAQALEDLIARVHRATALSRYLLEDERGVQRSFRGMLHADPRVPLPLDLAAVDHAIQLDRMAAEETLPEWNPKLRKPSLVDGVRTGAVPVDQHYVVQRTKGERVTRSRLHTTMPLPKRIKVIMVDHHQSAPAPRRLWYVGLGSAATSVALYSGALVTRLQYNSANQRPRDRDRAQRLFTTTNVLSVGAGVAALTSVGTLTAGEILRARDKRRAAP